MIMLPVGVKVFVATQPTDMRKSFHGLSLLAKDIFDENPTTGGLFLFINRAKDRIKILYYDQNGFAMWYKMLTRGTYQLSNNKTDNHYIISLQDLNLLLEDINLSNKDKNKKMKQLLIN